MGKSNVISTVVIVAVAGFIGYTIWTEETGGPAVSFDPVAPNWAAIAAWPGTTADTVEAQPDPGRRITAIILDDSGSMGADIEPAKRAVLDALDAMAPDDRVAVLALNAGTLLPFTPVEAARTALPPRLAGVEDTGSTPLTRAVQDAQRLLEAEAAAARGFGTFRVIVTTDGQADDGLALTAAIEDLAATTPIQLTTIGIGIRGQHVLRRADLGSFVDVADVGALTEALQAAVAENTDFTAITAFDQDGG
ncbi:MAG: VWA domain-containing protein [Shimia sp.]